MERITNLEGLQLLGKLLEEDIVDLLVHVHTRTSTARLTMIESATNHGNASQIPLRRKKEERRHAKERRQTHPIPKAAHETAVSRSASSQIMAGPFPPNSSVTFFKFELAALFKMCLPTSVLPVNATLSIPMCALIAAPAVLPNPVRMFTTPGGKPASWMSEAMRRAVRGVHSEGLNTMVLPVARAGAIFQASISICVGS